MSLATNLAVADALQAHGTGLFRIMASPTPALSSGCATPRKGYGLEWPEGATLAEFERTLDAAEPKQAAFMLAIRRAGQGASYEPFRSGEVPWHAAVAAIYAHATAPLRRLADRYVVQATLAIANGRPVPDQVAAAFPSCPP
jgi:exoribonuclease R